MIRVVRSELLKLRTTRTFNVGSLRLRVRAAVNPAVPPPRTTMSLIIGYSIPVQFEQVGHRCQVKNPC